MLVGGVENAPGVVRGDVLIHMGVAEEPCGRGSGALDVFIFGGGQQAISVFLDVNCESRQIAHLVVGWISCDVGITVNRVQHVLFAQRIAVKDGIKPRHVVNRPLLVARMQRGIHAGNLFVFRLRHLPGIHREIVGERNLMGGKSISPALAGKLLAQMKTLPFRRDQNPAFGQRRQSCGRGRPTRQGCCHAENCQSQFYFMQFVD
jgi:hypothetical protein